MNQKRIQYKLAIGIGIDVISVFLSAYKRKFDRFRIIERINIYSKTNQANRKQFIRYFDEQRASLFLGQSPIVFNFQFFVREVNSKFVELRENQIAQAKV